MRRNVASPDADTPSYWPVFISWTISSDVLPILSCTTHLPPIAFWNGCTQSTLLSLLPSSAYPAQLTRLRLPSSGPIVSCAFRLGTGGAAPLSPSPPLPPPLLPPPQAASSARVTTATPTADVARPRCIP